jgi:hypothetical protein
MSTVYLIVTVTMDYPSINVSVVVMITIEMMDLNQRIGHENESTGFASSVLRFQ